MAKQKPKYYVVWKGKTPGIYTSWAACEAEVKGVDAKYKGFATREEAEKAIRKDYTAYISSTAHPSSIQPAQRIASAPVKPIYPALAVDAACSGNPGKMEFRGVIADTGTEVFHRGPYSGGTNNVGEFLALVLGLAYLKANHLPWVLYSDSRTAIAWLRKGKAQTKLVPTPQNAELFRMLQQAEQWLATNPYNTHVYKWDTELWGEIPADFGRK